MARLRQVLHLPSRAEREPCACMGMRAGIVRAMASACECLNDGSQERAASHLWRLWWRLKAAGRVGRAGVKLLLGAMAIGAVAWGRLPKTYPTKSNRLQNPCQRNRRHVPSRPQKCIGLMDRLGGGIDDVGMYLSRVKCRRLRFRHPRRFRGSASPPPSTRLSQQSSRLGTLQAATEESQHSKCHMRELLPI